MYSFDHVWPYMGLGGALLLALLLSTDLLRTDRTVSRWYDIVWLTWLGTLAYLVHQFEEHGVDARGGEYSFRGFLCALTRYRLGWRAVIATVVAGIVLHGVLMASLLAYLDGRIGVVVLDAIQVINPVFAPLIVLLLGARNSSRASSHDRATGVARQVARPRR